MTIREQIALDKAITRAEANGIEVVAKGHRKSDNARIRCTTSHSDPARWHVVAVIGKRVVCDCKSHVICMHCAAVRIEIEYEVSRCIRQAEIVEHALMREAKVRDTAVFLRSNAPISLFR